MYLGLRIPSLLHKQESDFIFSFIFSHSRKEISEKERETLWSRRTISDCMLRCDCSTIHILQPKCIMIRNYITKWAPGSLNPLTAESCHWPTCIKRQGYLEINAILNKNPHYFPQITLNQPQIYVERKPILSFKHQYITLCFSILCTAQIWLRGFYAIYVQRHSFLLY